MMLPTHALFGMVLALPVVFVAPEHAGVALGAGFLGGVLPDLDLYVGHRRTLHYPTCYSVAASAGVGCALLWPSALTVGVGLFLLGAALHSVADVFGGGLELRPWEGTSNRAVYDHVRGRWLAPRRWVRYDGAPEDLLLAVGLAVPLWVVVDGAFRRVVLVALGVAVVYAALRRTLPYVAQVLFGRVLPRYVPASVLSVAPERYLADGDASERTAADGSA